MDPHTKKKQKNVELSPNSWGQTLIAKMFGNCPSRYMMSWSSCALEFCQNNNTTEISNVTDYHEELFFSNYSEARKSKDSLDYTQEIKMMCA